MLNYFLLSAEELRETREHIKDKSWISTPFAYYINNCVSCSLCPDWFGSAMCDLIRRGAVEGKIYDVDIVGYLINETFYKHISKEQYSVPAMIKDVVSVICEEKSQKEFLTRLEKRYGTR